MKKRKLPDWATGGLKKVLKKILNSSHLETSMCGIVSAIARHNIVPVLIEGLRRLEYRGYDSCGIAVLTDGAPRRVRSIARVEDLAAQVEKAGFAVESDLRIPAGRRTARQFRIMRIRFFHVKQLRWLITASSKIMKRCAKL